MQSKLNEKRQNKITLLSFPQQTNDNCIVFFDIIIVI